jgi:hypothetical protein
MCDFVTKSNTITKKQAIVNLASDALKLQEEIYKDTIDIDEVKYSSISIVENIIIIFQDSHFKNIFQIPNGNEEHSLNPKDAVLELSRYLRQVFCLIHAENFYIQQTRCEAISAIFGLLIKIGHFNNLGDLYFQAIEIKETWPEMKRQRNLHIKNHQDLGHLLTTTSCYPLSYQTGNSNNPPLDKLFGYLNNGTIPQFTATLAEYGQYLYNIFQQEKIQNHQNSQLLRSLILETTKCAENLLNEHDIHTFIFPILASISIPTYAETWSNRHPQMEQSKRKLSNIITPAAPTNWHYMHNFIRTDQGQNSSHNSTTPFQKVSRVYCPSNNYPNPRISSKRSTPARGVNRRRLIFGEHASQQPDMGTTNNPYQMNNHSIDSGYETVPADYQNQNDKEGYDTVDTLLGNIPHSPPRAKLSERLTNPPDRLKELVNDLNLSPYIGTPSPAPRPYSPITPTTPNLQRNPGI